MTEFDKIFVVWRKGQGSERHAIGILKHDMDGRNTFTYLPEAVELQEKEGFTPYTEFPDLTKEYNGNVAEIFGQRLTKTDRPDINNIFKFWEVDSSMADDKFYLLGKTQGLVATDNFEFLADYKLIPNIHFLTELAALSKIPLPKGVLQIGDKLTFKLDPNNPFDQFAVRVFKDAKEVGYIKKYHSKLFYEPGADKLQLTVIALEQNEIVKRAFIKIALL